MSTLRKIHGSPEQLGSSLYSYFGNKCIEQEALEEGTLGVKNSRPESWEPVGFACENEGQCDARVSRSPKACGAECRASGMGPCLLVKATGGGGRRADLDSATAGRLPNSDDPHSTGQPQRTGLTSPEVSQQQWAMAGGGAGRPLGPCEAGPDFTAASGAQLSARNH